MQTCEVWFNYSKISFAMNFIRRSIPPVNFEVLEFGDLIMSADVRTSGDESTPIKLYGRLIKVLNLTLPEGKRLLFGENAQIIPEFDHKNKRGRTCLCASSNVLISKYINKN